MSTWRHLGRLALRSAWHRRFGLAWVVMSVALSAFLLLMVERVREDVRENFLQSVSGTDLVVGPRTSPVQLLLYAVMRLGHPSHNIAWRSVQALQTDPDVAWVIPIALGDSYRGFPVVGTSADYFRHFRYGDQQTLRFQQGQPLADVFDVVLGAEVAERAGHRLGNRLVLAHGDGQLPGTQHADKPFRVVGVLARTGTAVDRSVHILLSGMQALHVDWWAGVPMPGLSVSPEQARQMDLTPRTVTAALVGLHTRTAVFAVQRRVMAAENEPLMAVLPGVVLDELWDMVGSVSQALRVLSTLVAGVSLVGLVAVILTGLEQRRRELAVLRAVGAAPRHLLGLLVLEGTGVSVLGVLLGTTVAACVLALVAPSSQIWWGVTLQPLNLERLPWAWLGGMIAAGMGASMLPAWRAYRLSLADGLSPQGG